MEENENTRCSGRKYLKTIYMRSLSDLKTEEEKTKYFIQKRGKNHKQTYHLGYTDDKDMERCLTS